MTVPEFAKPSAFEIHPEGAPDVASSRLRLLGMEIAARQGAGAVLEVDEDGRWSSSVPGLAREVGRIFGPAYVPTALYHPQGRPAAIAQDVAAVLGATYEYVGPASEEPEGEEGEDWVW